MNTTRESAWCPGSGEAWVSLACDVDAPSRLTVEFLCATQQMSSDVPRETSAMTGNDGSGATWESMEMILLPRKAG
ncbi:hypothetical protein GCM10009602_58640 [Nocardiopsis tropica]